MSSAYRAFFKSSQLFQPMLFNFSACRLLLTDKPGSTDLQKSIELLECKVILFYNQSETSMKSQPLRSISPHVL